MYIKSDKVKIAQDLSDIPIDEFEIGNQIILLNKKSYTSNYFLTKKICNLYLFRTHYVSFN